MRPGAWSEVGFLGRRERLNEVLARDRQTLVELGVTCEELADKLESLLDAAEESLLEEDRIRCVIRVGPLRSSPRLVSRISQSVPPGARLFRGPRVPVQG
jgi:hypothetical protein